MLFGQLGQAAQHQKKKSMVHLISNPRFKGLYGTCIDKVFQPVCTKSTKNDREESE